MHIQYVVYDVVYDIVYDVVYDMHAIVNLLSFLQAVGRRGRGRQDIDLHFIEASKVSP